MGEFWLHGVSYGEAAEAATGKGEIVSVSVMHCAEVDLGRGAVGDCDPGKTAGMVEAPFPTAEGNE